MRSPRAKIPKAMILIWVAALAAALLAGLPGKAAAQANEYHMDRYDSNITVNADGSLDITETLTFVFTNGTFDRGFRNWELDKLDEVTVTAVAEDKDSELTYYTQEPFNSVASDEPGAYSTDSDENELRLRWVFAATANTTRTFLITLHVRGAIWVGVNSSTLDWYGVPPKWESRVNQSQVRVTFPVDIVTNNWVVISYPQAGVSKVDNVITWNSKGDLDNGFEIVVEIPSYAMSFTKPSWQNAFEQQSSGNPDGNNGTTAGGILGEINGTQSIMGLGTFLVTMASLFEGILRRLILFFVGGV